MVAAVSAVAAATGAPAAWWKSRRGLRPAVKRFRDIGLHHQRNVAGDLAAGSGKNCNTEPPERGRDGATAPAAAQLSAPASATTFRCRREAQGARCAAELQRQSFAARLCKRARMQCGGIFRKLEPERHRQCLRNSMRDDA